MINGAADLNMLLILTERGVDRGDELIKRHGDVQRDCAEHAVELQKLIELHARVGRMLAEERQRFAAYFPQAEPPRARIAAGQTSTPRENADAPQKRS